MTKGSLLTNRARLVALLLPALFFFLLGRYSRQAAQERSAEASVAEPDQVSMKTERPLRAASAILSEDEPTRAGRTEREAAIVPVLEPREAAMMTREERLARFERAMMLWEPSEQAAIVCGLIGGLKKDEIREAVDLLVLTQQRGNYFPPSVWEAIWNRWGKLDGEACFRYLQGGSALTSRSMRMKNGPREVGREVMQGWLSANPSGALAWATQPRESFLETAAAAMALTHSAHGDLAMMEEILSAHLTNSAVVAEGLVDYFDVAMLQSDDVTVEAIYHELPSGLRPHALRETCTRLLLDDPNQAIKWLADNGPRGEESYQLLVGYAHSSAINGEHVAGVKALSNLPYRSSEDHNHPITMPLLQWLEHSPEEAKQWLATQPEDAPWHGLGNSSS